MLHFVQSVVKIYLSKTWSGQSVQICIHFSGSHCMKNLGV